MFPLSPGLRSGVGERAIATGGVCASVCVAMDGSGNDELLVQRKCTSHQPPPYPAGARTLLLFLQSSTVARSSIIREWFPPASAGRFRKPFQLLHPFDHWCITDSHSDLVPGLLRADRPKRLRVRTQLCEWRQLDRIFSRPSQCQRQCAFDVGHRMCKETWTLVDQDHGKELTYPRAITSGPDGTIWYVGGLTPNSIGMNTIGRITPP